MKDLFDFSAPNVWATLKNCREPIVLYGMGNAADRVLDEFARRGITAAGVMASDDFCRYQSFRGFTVKKQSDFEEEFAFSVSPRSSMQSLSRRSVTAPFTKGSLCGCFTIALCFGSDLPDVMTHIYDVAEQHTVLVPNIPVVGDILMDESYLEAHKDAITRAYELLADEASRAVFKGALDFFYTGRLEILPSIESEKDAVFRDILRLRDERYLDLGAFRGDTVDEFLRYTDGYESITAVEPNPKNFGKLQEHIAVIRNAKALHAGIADKEGRMYITKGSGRMAALNADSGVEAAVTTVDAIGCRPTYIKADVEGMESAMLKGAERTIRELKPKLNIAAYHRTGDFFELILQIHQIDPDYQIYLRKHPYIPCWDLNIYAV